MTETRFILVVLGSWGLIALWVLTTGTDEYAACERQMSRSTCVYALR